MSVGELVTNNLTSPAVLAFALGAVAVAFRGSLRLPEQVTGLLSTYLLLAIGVKGGLRLQEADFGDMWGPIIATVAIGCVTPIVTFAAARRVVGLSVVDSASLAAHFGSVSAVTFTAAEGFARSAGTLNEGFLPALMTILEVPGIVIALVIANRKLGGSDIKSAIHEVLTGKSILLLIGGLIIGAIASDSGQAAVEPFFITLFPGVLCLFLLDLGSLAAERFEFVQRAGLRFIVLTVVLPMVFGTFGVAAGTAAGLSEGGAMVLGAMAASASYIAAPAAVRVALPEADVGVSLGAAIGVTFPFNLVAGIPLYSEIAALLS